jgi:flagellar biosynthesis/type III secretory pathway chaperone
MQKDVQRLADILNRHLERQSRLLALAEEKRGVIVENNTSRLDEITAEEEELLGEVQDLETERAACVAAIGRDLKLGEAPSVDAILAADPEAAGALEPVRGRLREVVESLRRRNGQNEALLAESVKHIERFFANLAQARSTPGTYGRHGDNQGEQMRLVDHEA